MPRQGPANKSPSCGPHYYVWPGLWVYAGCPSLAPLPTAHCPLHLCVGSPLHAWNSHILSPGTLLLDSYHSASWLRRSCWSQNAARYPTAPSLLCGWSDSLEWSPYCAASDASGPLCSLSL